MIADRDDGLLPAEREDHFLGREPAQLVGTDTLLTTRDNIEAVIEAKAMMCVYGPAGSGMRKAHTTGDGLIRVFDVFNHVAEKVRTSVPDVQHPIFKASDLEDNFPVALDRGGLKTPAPSQPAQPDRWREIETIMADLYPAGPTDQEIWARAGGDLSRLRLHGTGRANWFVALRNLKLGGGGQQISPHTLLETATDDFPHHPELTALKARE